MENAENLNSDSEIVTKTDSTFLNLDFTWNIYENGEMNALVKDRGGCSVYLLKANVPKGKNRKEIIKLVELLQIIAKHGINMTKIESRPVKNRPGDYRFFIEADCDIGTAEVQEMLEAIQKDTLECKLIGAYSRD